MFKLLIGNRHAFSLENRIYVIACLVGTIAGIVALIWDFKLGLPLTLNIVVGLAVIIYCVLYYYSRFKKKFSSFVFLFTTLCFLSVVWMLNEGIMGSVPTLFIVFTAVFIAISKSKLHFTFIAITLVNYVALIILEGLYYEEIVVPYPSVNAKKMDLIFGYVASLLIIYFITSFFKKSYESEHEKITVQKIKLQKANASKDLFFNILAHDLRSPFNNILGFTEIMASKSEELSRQELKQFAQLTNQSALKTFELLETLLKWGEIQRGEVQINPQVINLKEFILESIQFFKEESDNKGMNVKVEIDRNIQVHTDLHILQTISRNLISNAIKFTPEGGQINILSESSNQNKVMLIVEDSGIGMDKNMLNKLFDLQENTNRNGTNGESSVGLGLVICKELVEKLGEELKIESEVNKGSKFWLTLQLKS